VGYSVTSQVVQSGKPNCLGLRNVVPSNCCKTLASRISQFVVHFVVPVHIHRLVVIRHCPPPTHRMDAMRNYLPALRPRLFLLLALFLTVGLTLYCIGLGDSTTSLPILPSPGEGQSGLRWNSLQISDYLPWSSHVCPHDCVADPFVQPGMVYWDPNGLFNNTRWIPFKHTLPEEKIVLAEVRGTTAEDAFDNAAEQFTASLNTMGLEGLDAGQAPEWDWARGRYIVFIGTSGTRRVDSPSNVKRS
jgi:hypothetical protein